MYAVAVDRSLCSGFGTCSELAPAVFEVDEHGLVVLRTGTSVDVAVLEAAAACPMGAIIVGEVEAA
jgi:ferredoxin